MKFGVLVPSLRGGGAERVALDVCNGLMAGGHSVTLMLMAAEGAYMDEIPNGVNVIDLSCPRLWTSVPALTAYLRRGRPDAILAVMPLANGVAVLARALAGVSCRVVLSEHNARSLIFGGAAKSRYHLLGYLIRRVYRFADGVVAVSRGVADRLGTLPGIKPERIHVVYNPAYSPMIEQRATEAVDHPWFGNSVVPVILSVGRLVKQKDYPTLIRAFDLLRRCRPARLIILGEDKERRSLECLLGQLGLAGCACLPGFVNNPWAWMARASLFVLSSRHEGFGNVLVEAMACGTPVVATDCPAGPSEILDGGRYGGLTPVGDPVALKDAMMKALDNPTPAEVLKNRARSFSLEKAVEGYLRVLIGGADDSR